MTREQAISRAQAIANRTGKTMMVYGANPIIQDWNECIASTHDVMILRPSTSVKATKKDR